MVTTKKYSKKYDHSMILYTIIVTVLCSEASLNETLHQ
jgi:hypothetical protein